MKKIINYLLIITLMFCLTITNADASTYTYTRTSSDLRVPTDIKVTSSNRNAILNTPSVNETEKIYDFAYLLSSSEEQEIYEDVVDYIEEYNVDMIIVTINSNNKYSATAYADDFFDYNNFGKNSSRDGIVLLIDMDNREVAISTSGKAQLIYDDERIDAMLDTVYPYLSNGNYKNAVDTFTSKAASFASLGIPSSNKNYTVDENGNYILVKPFPWFWIIVISLGITLVIMLILLSRHKMIRKAIQATAYLDKNSINITNRQDVFITTFTNTTRIASSSGGSGRGGSSVHRSSSGRSHGGGSRRF